MAIRTSSHLEYASTYVHRPGQHSQCEVVTMVSWEIPRVVSGLLLGGAGSSDRIRTVSLSVQVLCRYQATKRKNEPELSSGQYQGVLRVVLPVRFPFLVVERRPESPRDYIHHRG